jgi:DsbC/DsbD-like thiol-disulfide interchange protein
VAAHNLVRLWIKTGDKRYRELAERTFNAFSANLKANPTSMVTLAEALTLYLDAEDKEKSKSPLNESPQSKDGKPKKSEAVVKVEASATKPDADHRQTITVKISIDKPWHLYANPVPEDFPGIPTSLTVEANGKNIDAKTEYPRGKLMKDKTLGDYHVYEDEVKIQTVIQRSKDDTTPLTIIVKVQACSDKQCLLPGTVKVRVP